MADLLKTLEEQSRTWHAISRQGLADAIWFHYVRARFKRTGDTRALEYLYPYLNNARTRHQAIRVACEVFEGRGPRALEDLTYFLQNPDLFIKDRAVNLVGAAVTGSSDDVILEALSPYLKNKNMFIRLQAVIALGKAARGLASERVYQVLLEVGETTNITECDLTAAISTVYEGKANDEVYRRVVKPETNWATCMNDYGGDSDKDSRMIDGADISWFERICEDIWDPMLKVEEEPEEVGRRWMRGIRHREAAKGVSVAGAGRGMVALERILRVRQNGSAIRSILNMVPRCVIGAKVEDCFDPLMTFVKDGDVPTQRIAAVCLGRLMMGHDDDATIQTLADLCQAKNHAVRAAALRGLAMAARSTCDEALRGICKDLMDHPETAREAIRALGAIYLGSGRGDVFEDICGQATRLRSSPLRGKKHSKPLAACYFAAGLVYVGTGSMEPVEFLLDGVARPRESQHMAARGLVMIEFPESVLGNAFLGVDDFDPVEEDKEHIAFADW